MDATERETVVYVDRAGRCPFELWLARSKDKQATQKILARLLRVRLGNFGDAKTVGSGVRELRIDTGPGYRVYLAEDGRTLVVVLCGGDKSTQQKDIARAKEFWHDYQTTPKSKGL